MTRKIALMVLAGFFFSAALSAFPAFAQSIQQSLPSGTSGESLSDSIKELYLAHENESGALAVAVFDEEGIISRHYFGFQDKENQLPADASTVFEWASISKLLVWVSVMQLFEDGLLDLHEDVREYLPEGFLSNLKYPDPLTMTDLMNHKGGFQETIADLLVEDPQELTDLGGALKAHPPAQIYRPGTTAAYSTWGTALAAYIVELLAGIPFHQYVRNEILDPLSMDRTAVRGDLSDNPWVREQREKLQCYDAGGRLLKKSRYYIPLYPAGSATGTLDDLIRFARALILPPSGSSLLFTHRATHERFLSATSWYGDTGIASGTHGLWGKLLGVPVLGHAGNTAGSSTSFLFHKESGVSAVVLTNQLLERYYTEGIMDEVFGSFANAHPDLAERELPKGLYRSARTIRKGPLSVFSFLMFLFSEEDLEEFWVEDALGGTTRLVLPYRDLLKVELLEYIPAVILLTLLATGVMYALGTLILGGLILTPLKRREARRMRFPIEPYPLRKTNLVASILTLLWTGNLIFLAKRVLNFHHSSSYIWQIGLTALLGLAMILLLLYYISPIRKKNLRNRDKLKTALTAVFLTAFVAATIYWEMYAFWAL